MGRRKLVKVLKGQCTLTSSGKLVRARRGGASAGPGGRARRASSRRGRPARRGKENADANRTPSARSCSPRTRGRRRTTQTTLDVTTLPRPPCARPPPATRATDLAGSSWRADDGVGALAWDKYVGGDGPVVRRADPDGRVEVLTSQGFVDAAGDLAGRGCDAAPLTEQGEHVELRRLPLFARGSPLDRSGGAVEQRYDRSVTNWAVARDLCMHLALSSLPPACWVEGDPASEFGLFASCDLVPGHRVPFAPGAVTPLGGASAACVDALAVVRGDGGVFREGARSLASFARDPRGWPVQCNAVLADDSTPPALVLVAPVRRGMEIFVARGVAFWLAHREHCAAMADVARAMHPHARAAARVARHAQKQSTMFRKMYHAESRKLATLRRHLTDERLSDVLVAAAGPRPPAPTFSPRASLFAGVADATHALNTQVSASLCARAAPRPPHASAEFQVV